MPNKDKFGSIRLNIPAYNPYDPLPDYPSNPHGHLFDVRMTLTSSAAIRKSGYQAGWAVIWWDFAKNIIDLKAEDQQGNPLQLFQKDKQSWQIATEGQTWS